MVSPETSFSGFGAGRRVQPVSPCLPELCVAQSILQQGLRKGRGARVENLHRGDLSKPTMEIRGSPLQKMPGCGHCSRLMVACGAKDLELASLSAQVTPPHTRSYSRHPPNSR